MLLASSFVVAVVACGAVRQESVLVAMPSTAATWLSDSKSRATTTSGVTVEAQTRGFPGPPLALGSSATPLHVRIENNGHVPLKVSRDSFELVAGTASFRALPPDQIGARADLRRRELHPGTLDPGESEAGFVYFEPVEGHWPFLHLRTLLVSATNEELLDSIDVPFGSGHIVDCTLEHAALTEAPTGENILFRGCLPSP